MIFSITHVCHTDKEKLEIIEREKYNTIKSENAKQLECSLKKEKLIEEVPQYSKMIL